ncbi:hypothetical protein HAZT_HAZT002924 [Hyalella azteca]|uniref:DM13 domain-containing protein n=1 Tax=Hyalella azteca TaxID=294128 RepID=A0A6A0H0P0_HYAAZ|nr:hypothetical protein HAZT_HAZT002924 [Hyalella azteca]
MGHLSLSARARIEREGGSAVSSSVDAQYLGKRIGALSELQHGVKGEVFAVDSRTIHVKGFSYDGAAPGLFLGTKLIRAKGSPCIELIDPNLVGRVITIEEGSRVNTQPLKRYRNKDVTLTLPEGITLKDVKWISVWCRAFAIDFGHVVVPSGLQYPRPQKINALSTLDHGVSSDRLVVVDAQTFLIPNFSYDGAAPEELVPGAVANSINIQDLLRVYSVAQERLEVAGMPAKLSIAVNLLPVILLSSIFVDRVFA